MQVQETTLQPLTESRTVPPLAAQRSAAAGPDGRLARQTREPRESAAASEEQEPVFERNSRARLSLDPELHRVFVEIIDPETGDVISRFPPEQLITHIDRVLAQTEQKTNLQDSGLIVDEKV